MRNAEKPSNSQDRNLQDLLVGYHSVLPYETDYLYDVSSSLFDEHLRFFSSRKNEGKQAVNVTFDDGHRSNYEHALPILERAQCHATFFLLVGSLGNDQNYLTWQQVREMAAIGHHMESHGWAHSLLTSCGVRQLERELVRSKKLLEDRLGTEVNSLSAPGGRWNRRVIEMCSKAGYKFFYHSNPWSDPIAVDGVIVRGRMMITGQMDQHELKRKFDSSAARRKLHLAIYEAKESARSLLGDRLYHRLWRWKANYSDALGVEIVVEDKEEPSPADGGRVNNGQ